MHPTKEVAGIVSAAVKAIYDYEVTPEVTYTDAKFGDYASNVALRLAKELKKPPMDIANELSQAITHQNIAAVEAVAPGFINISLKDEALLRLLEGFLNTKAAQPEQFLQGQTVVAEYSDPNPFKELHAGHLYTSVIGDAIANLTEAAGAKVHRVNFGGDVGLHVGKAMWGIIKRLGGEELEKLKEVPEDERANWMAGAYVEGAFAYEQDAATKEEINAVNKRVYQLHNSGDKDSFFAKIYWTCRHWSYDYFSDFYKRIGSDFDRYYPESETMSLGLEAVKVQLKEGVFEESDGAVVFRGEKYGLHTRVFITSEGLPTYEAKEVGLSLAKWRDYRFDRSIIITGNDISDYMRVVLKAIEQFEPELTKRTSHVTHGIVKLKGQGKMSSRKGEVLRAADVLDSAQQANRTANNSDDQAISLGAVKYTFLKQQIGDDIVFDPIESVNLHGNSGPYLQYVYVRTRSVLRKLESAGAVDKRDGHVTINEEERALIKHLSRHAEAVETAARDYAPHILGVYLFDLARLFNVFYENNRIIGDAKESFRIDLVQAVEKSIREGLQLLGIEVPERM